MTENKVQYNKIPADNHLVKDVIPLKKNEIAEYRLCGVVDPAHPSKLFLKTMPIPPTDIVIDEEGNTWDIAAIKNMGPAGVPNFFSEELWFNDTQLSTVKLNGSKAVDQILYKYFEMTNFNISNKNRDTSRAALFERVDENKDIDQKRSKWKKSVEVMNMIDEWTDEEVLNFTRANHMADAGSAAKRRYALEDLAQKNPSKFEGAVTVDFTSLKEPIELARKKKIIQYNNLTRQWLTHDGKLIFEVKKGFGISQVNELSKFLMSTEGKDFLTYIKSELEK